MNRRELMGKAFHTVAGACLATGSMSLLGCSDNGVPIIGTDKKRDDPSLQREVELPAGIPIQEKAKSKKKH